MEEIANVSCTIQPFSCVLATNYVSGKHGIFPSVLLGGFFRVNLAMAYLNLSADSVVLVI